MFTGIIQSIASVDNISQNKNIYRIKTSLSLNDCKVGSSICCDGVCLTVTDIIVKNSDYFFLVNIGDETLKRTNLNYWKLGKKINIEKSLKVGDEISGHFVYGHIDTSIKLSNIDKLNKSWEFNFDFSENINKENIKKFIVEKGSIAINGISLTVASIFEYSFYVSVIPHTYKNTNLSLLMINDMVNIEFDPLARYIYKYYDK